MKEQNAKVMAMSDLELKAIIKKGEVNTFLHFQANREYNARHNGGKRHIDEEDELYWNKVTLGVDKRPLRVF